MAGLRPGAAQRLVDRLGRGTIGCLLSGRYHESLVIRRGALTLRAAPGARVELLGSIWVRRTAAGVSVSDLSIDASSASTYRPEWADEEGLPASFRETRPALIVNGDGFRLERSEVTNRGGICVLLGSAGGAFGTARDPVLEENRIHGCGRLRPDGRRTNHDHGVYVESARHARIVRNLVYDNRDRGIQLYPDAQGSLVDGNTLARNGEGIVFGGNDELASSANVVSGNVIADSQLADDAGRRYSVDSSWGGAIGVSNLFDGNCVWQPSRESWAVQRPPIGFEERGTRFLDPDFADERAGDLTVRAAGCSRR